MQKTTIDDLKEALDKEPTERVIKSRIYDQDKFVQGCINEQIKENIQNEVNEDLPKED